MNEVQSKLLSTIQDMIPENQRSSFVRLAILGKQFGELQNCAFYTHISDQETRKGYEIYAQTAMRDMLAQCYIYSSNEGWDPDKLLTEGLRMAFERITKHKPTEYEEVIRKFHE